MNTSKVNFPAQITIRLIALREGQWFTILDRPGVVFRKGFVCAAGGQSVLRFTDELIVYETLPDDALVTQVEVDVTVNVRSMD